MSPTRTGIVLLLAIGLAQPQNVTQTPGPVFEVASIKPTSPDLVGMQLTWTPNNSRVTIKGLTLKDLIRFSYAEGRGLLASNLVSGGPSWYDRERFDIDAKAEGPRFPSLHELAVGPGHCSQIGLIEVSP
jgi:hypothetical protein